VINLYSSRSFGNVGLALYRPLHRLVSIAAIEERDTARGNDNDLVSFYCLLFLFALV
jgi:hypothetical protein